LHNLLLTNMGEIYIETSLDAWVSLDTIGLGSC
jgi:hypothetical protein